MKLLVQKLDERAVLPSRAHHDDAGLDLYALEAVTLAPGERQAVSTGVALAIPSGYVGLIWDKSGISFNHGLKNMGGVIDAQYRGEVKVILVNLSQETVTLEAGQKIAQLLIQKVKLPEIEIIDLLPGSFRGEGGFGSTGK
jgi:dUTP pyrophosphatase